MNVSAVRLWMVPFSNDTFIAAVKKWVLSAGVDFHSHGLQALLTCWQKRIANDCGYGPKQHLIVKNLSVLLCFLHLLYFLWKQKEALLLEQLTYLC